MTRRHVSLATFVLGSLLGLGVLSTPASAHAEDETDFQIWVAILGTYDLRPAAPVPSLWLDVHARRSDVGTVHILRPGFGFAPTPWMSFWVGYAWIPTFNDATGDTVNEHRFWNQWIFAHQTEFRLALQSRTRTEYRFREAGDDVGLRLRQFVRVGWQPSARIPLGCRRFRRSVLRAQPSRLGGSARLRPESALLGSLSSGDVVGPARGGSRRGTSISW